MKSTVYIETTIPSFYYETRTGAEFVAMRDWTRRWWDKRKDGYKCFISIAVLDELENGDIASFHKVDYLLTWNCKHLANANKKKHIR